MTQYPFLQLARLRVLRRGHAAYDQHFHGGVNIIRGQNGSGKSTIADFIFFVLGGAFDDWKDAASQCDEVQAEVSTPRGKLVLIRRIGTAQEPVSVFFGSMDEAAESGLDRWERFPLYRQGGRESFSQVMFRSLLIPEAQSEGASNITIHQLLRLCYSDQRTPATRLFRFENFDTNAIREAVGDLMCGVAGYELFELRLSLRETQKKYDIVDARLSSLIGALRSDEALNTPDVIHNAIARLQAEKLEITAQISAVDELVEPGKVKGYLNERSAAQKTLVKERNALHDLEMEINAIDFELREIAEFRVFLAELIERLSLAEFTFDAIGSIDFTHCPACGEELTPHMSADHCFVCKAPRDSEREKSRYNQIRLDLEIQTRETKQLDNQKTFTLTKKNQELRQLRLRHEQNLSQFDLRFAGGNGPREAFLATRTNRIGHIDAEIKYLLSQLETAENISQLSADKARINEMLNGMKSRIEALRVAAGQHRSRSLSKVSTIAASLLRADLPRQDEFKVAKSVTLDFPNDSIAVDGRINFAESSNVFLKNAAILSLFLAASEGRDFFHPHFILLDNIEDKGMQEERSHLFQRLIVERATEVKRPYQVIFTTSMMNPNLELDDYVIGPAYTSEHRTLDLGYDRRD
jgi:hypothetical protein